MVVGAAPLCHMSAMGGTESPGSSRLMAREASRNPAGSSLLYQAPHLSVLSPVSLGFCPPQPYREPEPSVAEPPSCPLALNMSLRDSSYSVAPGPCVVAQLPSEDMGHLTDPQSRDHGFLRTKMKVMPLTLSLRARGVHVDLRPAHKTWHK